MKKIFKTATLALISFASLSLACCSDFEEVNTNPFAVGPLVTKAYYALNKSILFAQQNPDTAERLFVINWAAAARQDGEDGYGISVGYYNDSYNSAAFNHMSSSLSYCNTCIELCDEQSGADGLIEAELAFLPNLRRFARIWRVYLMSEFADSFGPMPINGFQGSNPDFDSVKDVYYYMYEELAEAVSGIDLSVEPTTDQAACDPAYGYDAAKWKAYGISMWMRLAMRLSEADTAKAKEEFEKAVAAGNGILTADGVFGVKEQSGWDELSGVMSRTWDTQSLSATMANLTTNLGGTTAADILNDGSGVIYETPDVTRYEDCIKDASTYLGKRFENHWLECTDNPTKFFFFDGIPEHIDPRAFVYFYLPGDFNNRKNHDYFGYPNLSKALQVEWMYDKSVSDELKKLEPTETDATYCWNGLTAGIWEDETAGTYNGLVAGGNDTYGYIGTYPALTDEYRDNTNTRVFFGPWETYFLLAEAAVRGWQTGTTAEAAYNAGIKASLEYTNMGHHYATYIESENYNRVGTSVKFTHTTEPSATQMTYVDGYTGQEQTTTYSYPDASKILYAGHKLNDQLTKIITQKYIANTPWLPLENWSDHRRLGLPFFEIPASTTALSYMPAWSQTSYQGAQKSGYFIQRMKYPSSLNNADPTGYAHAVELLGGADATTTPIWWAIDGH